MEHSITPPPELLSKWENEILKRHENVDVQLLNAYQAGADAELNACCGWIESLCGLGGLMTSAKFRCEVSDRLRAARRPASLTTKELALLQVQELIRNGVHKSSVDVILNAIELLPDETTAS